MPSNNDNLVQRVILVEGVANTIVLVAKAWVGLSTGSLAILGDAIHSLGDVANNIIGWFVVRLASLPADRKHPYGHRKFETLAVFALAALLMVFAFELALGAFRRERSVIVSSDWEVAVMVGVLAVNLALAWWERSWAQRLQSDILVADSSHTFSDVLTTLVIIVGWQLSTLGYVWLDSVCAIGVASLIIYLAFDLFRRALPGLVDEFAIDPIELTRAVLEVDGVESVKRVRSRWLGNHRAVDMVVTVDAALTLTASHEIANAIESRIEQRFDVHDISIHVEPFD